jgi:hypothetical protein
LKGSFIGALEEVSSCLNGAIAVLGFRLDGDVMEGDGFLAGGGPPEDAAHILQLVGIREHFCL